MTDDERIAAIRALLSPEVDAPWLDGPTCRFLLDALDAARAENERLRVAADPARVGQVESLIRHATKLVQIERDDARADRDAANATLARVRALHTPTTWPNGETVCAGCQSHVVPCDTIRALDDDEEEGK